VGALGEQLAAAHLERLGYTVLARNALTRHGEIDLIALDGRTLVFAELRSGHSSAGAQPAGPAAWPRPGSGARLRRRATAWLSSEDAGTPRARAIRFDALSVTVDANGALLRLEHLEGAW
jgi:putative endonuclease